MLYTILVLARFSPESIFGAGIPTPDSTSDLARKVVRSPSVPKEDLKQRTVENILAGKDSDYVIRDPRPAWAVRWTNLVSILVEETSIVDAEIISNFERNLPGADLRRENV